jgi:hypothetical protein
MQRAWREKEPESSREEARTSLCDVDRRDGHGSVLEDMEVSGKLESVWLLVAVCSFGAFFSLRQRSRGVFSGPVFAARLWFLPLGLRSKMVAPIVHS